MRLKNSFFYTLREDPSLDASKSGSLLVKAGMIEKTASGIYVYTPMGYKVLENVKRVIREEMNNAGAEELLMPSLLPLEVYEPSGRTEAFGPDMFKLTDRAGRKYALGPTHEEMFTILAKEKVRSYKDLPFTLYQFGDKFRDEARPRYGVIRVREFIMKDAYSFDTKDTLDESYTKMFNAYKRAFDRLGINYRIVRSSNGAMGGDLSEEFQAITDIGEDTLVLCDECGYAANIEVSKRKYIEDTKEEKELTLVSTPNKKTIEEVTEFLNVDIKNTVKALLMKVDNELVTFFIRGDRNLNEDKVKELLNAKEVEFANDELIATSNACPGFTGPVNLNTKIVIDEEVKYMKNFVTGANKKDYHYINTNLKDFKYDLSGDITDPIEGDLCPTCGKPLMLKKGIEIGNTFKLGTHYTESFNLKYLNKDNKEELVTMGCYGIGIGRVLGAIVEQNNDDKGIIFPMCIAPFKVAIALLNTKDEEQTNFAYDLESKLTKLGIDVLVDDRDERPGVKFNDLELIGIPIRITIGRDFINNEVEIKLRDESESFKVNINDIESNIKEIINNKLK